MPDRRVYDVLAEQLYLNDVEISTVMSPQSWPDYKANDPEGAAYYEVVALHQTKALLQSGLVLLISNPFSVRLRQSLVEVAIFVIIAALVWLFFDYQLPAGLVLLILSIDAVTRSISRYLALTDQSRGPDYDR